MLAFDAYARALNILRAGVTQYTPPPFLDAVSRRILRARESREDYDGHDGADMPSEPSPALGPLLVSIVGLRE